MIQLQVFIGKEEVLLTTSVEDILGKVRELVMSLNAVVWNGTVLMNIGLLLAKLPSSGENVPVLTDFRSDVQVSIVKTALSFSAN